MMAPDIQRFPDVLFPNSNTKWKGYTTVDYGVNDAFDITFENGELESKSRKIVEVVDDTYDRLKPVNPCLPLTIPNDIGNSPLEEIRDVSICQHEYNIINIGKHVKTNKHSQLNNFFMDHKDLLVGEILGDLNKNNLDLICRGFHPLKYACDIPLSYSKRIHRPDNHRQFFNEHSHAKRSALLRFSRKQSLESRNFVKELDVLLDTIFEIPKSILLDYLDEELVIKYDELTQNFHIGNCLAKYKNCLIYPKGSLESVCISPMVFEEDKCMATVQLSDSEDSQIISTNGKIQEISCLDFHDQSSVLGIRNEYCCSFLSDSSQSLERNGKYFNMVDEISMESRILAMSMNPYFANEAIILLEDGSLKCWADGHLSFVQDNNVINYCTANDASWINCIYGSSPRSVLFVNSEEASVYDMRAPRKPCQLVLQLPNQFLNRMDKLARPACLHPANPHSLMLTSEQGLVLLDERFLRSPLMTINHYMRDRPQFMHTLTDEVDSTFRTMAFLGGHRYQDTRCLEFEQRGIKSTTLYSKISEQEFITQPPVCTQMPWKLATPNSWLRKVSNDARVTSPGVTKRLSQPLIGLSVLEMEASLSKDLLAIQLTKVGDLFYQVLAKNKGERLQNCEGDSVTASRNSGPYGDAYSPGSKKSGSRNQARILQDTEKKCMEWVACAYDTYNKNSMVNEKANLCFLEVDTSHGDIVQVSDSQGKSRGVFKRSQNENAMFHDSSSGSRKSYINIENSIVEGYESNTIKNFELKGRSRLKKNKALGDDETGQSNEPMLENIIRFCHICRRPLEEDFGSQCPGCGLDSDISCNLEIAYEKDGLLSNRILGQSVEPPILSLIKNPERSRDPLSVVLLTNWDNDDSYTPLNLSNADAQNIDRNGEEFCAHHAKTSEPSDERMGDVEGRNENSDSWFLSASGRLEFGPEETPRRKKEKDLNTYRTGPVTRSRSKCLSRSSERRKIKKTKVRYERMGKYLRTVSPSRIVESVAREVDSNEIILDRMEFVPPDELISTPKQAGEFSSMFRDIFSPKKSSAKTITYGAVTVKEAVPNSPQNFAYISENEQQEKDSKLEMSSGKNEGENSMSITPYEGLSTCNDLLIDSTPKHSSSSTVRGTPKKKQKSREMGF